MKYKRYTPLLILVLIILWSNATSFAQCAMCKTSVESDLKTGGSIGKNLNTGIIYLMLIPYVILITGAYFFFRKQINAKLRTWKNKYFPAKLS
jgi:hypothetical protein